ncbi:hypothetical protein CKO24_10810 [Rhodothalassium salexigens DSM 2132]|nr:hypothetical protein [Rhodothalassium salexigens DSM 2132]
MAQRPVLALQRFIFSLISVAMPARCPLSIWAFLTHSSSVWADQSTFEEIDTTPAQRDSSHWPSRSRTMPTAHSPTSGEYLFVV